MGQLSISNARNFSDENFFFSIDDLFRVTRSLLNSIVVIYKQFLASWGNEKPKTQ